MARKRLIEFDDLDPGDVITVFAIEPRAVTRGKFVDFMKLPRSRTKRFKGRPYFLRLNFPYKRGMCCIWTARIDGIQRHRRAKAKTQGGGKKAPGKGDQE